MVSTTPSGCSRPSHKSSLSLPNLPSLAVARVFGTTELLEGILLHLGDIEQSSWRRLYVVQRVNKRFQNVIYGSPSLRRAMHLQPPKSALIAPELSAVMSTYRAFFAATQCVLSPFRCDARPNTESGEMILSFNVSLSWKEESPGVMVGRSPGNLDGSSAIEQAYSWRNMVVPFRSGQQMEFHCCGSPVVGSLAEGITLGELADKAISAGGTHLDGLQPVMFYG